jgi:hypothetical protein
MKAKLKSDIGAFGLSVKMADAGTVVDVRPFGPAWPGAPLSNEVFVVNDGRLAGFAVNKQDLEFVD